MSRRGQVGFAHVWTLLLVALFAAGATSLVRQDALLSVRSRETQLLWAGGQIQAAIRDYYSSNLARGDRYPPTLEALLESPRPAAGGRRYLRRLYIDPMTGRPDWGLVRSPQGGIMGVFSKAPGTPLRNAGFPIGLQTFAGARHYADWVFVYDPAGLLNSPVR